MEATSFILKGCTVSLELFAITAVLSMPLGILAALGKMSKNKILFGMLSFYTWIFRGSPLLIQVFFVYFGLPVLGISLNALTAASIAFVLNYGAYLAEIFRGGLLSVEAGQMEAARALGMSYWQAMRRIVIPQAARNAVPAVSNEGVILVKDTSLIAVIGVADILRNANELVSTEFVVYPFLIAGLVYLVLSTVVLAGFDRLEKKYSVYS
ncbi:MAG: transporter permease [Firmicutes bacterium]|nr:transporter permease [Bacillota bacterium]